MNILLTQMQPPVVVEFLEAQIHGQEFVKSIVLFSVQSQATSWYQ